MRGIVKWEMPWRISPLWTEKDGGRIPTKGGGDEVRTEERFSLLSPLFLLSPLAYPKLFLQWGENSLKVLDGSFLRSPPLEQKMGGDLPRSPF